jgi:hypothetical protein
MINESINEDHSGKDDEMNKLLGIGVSKKSSTKGGQEFMTTTKKRATTVRVTD